MEKDTNILYLPPYTNRGVENTIKSGLILLFDWLQATIFPDHFFNDIYDLFYHLFKVNRFEVLLNEKSPHFGYDCCYSYRNICLFTSSRSDMGIHIYLTGSGCRDLEDLGISYKELFSKLIALDCQFTRIDISFDNFTNNYFNLKKINRCIKKNEVVTKFRSSIEFIKSDLSKKENLGYTIWFGSRASDIQIVFYDKLKERESNNVEIIDNLKYWFRLEVRLRNDKARDVIYYFMYRDNFNDYFKGIISNYVSFKVRNKQDSNRSRWSDRKWWSNFLGRVNKVKFQSKPVEYSITKKRSWLDHTVSRSSFNVLLSDIEDLSSDEIMSNYLYEFFKKGSKKLTKTDLENINLYRVKNNLVPIKYEEVEDFVSSVKDFLIVKDKK